VLEILRRRLG
jgi:hypothetical protein